MRCWPRGACGDTSSMSPLIERKPLGRKGHQADKFLTGYVFLGKRCVDYSVTLQPGIDWKDGDSRGKPEQIRRHSLGAAEVLADVRDCMTDTDNGICNGYTTY